MIKGPNLEPETLYVTTSSNAEEREREIERLKQRRIGKQHSAATILQNAIRALQAVKELQHLRSLGTSSFYEF